MASLIPGFEYDIFISYRQKDNKHDGWVTEFVDQLKGELESTFKEEISVYFDINPHDGLLETHDVDASLKDKLKSAVFIPIISRTYCDLKSFAWEHEFKKFTELASNDQFGLKVKLPSGNVANRILPVQIHDLDAEDKTLLERELGGFLRGIEFIYKEPGVNRPLTPGDDENKSSNNIKYKNQINKVANAISEIIAGIRNPERVDKESKKEVSEEKNSIRKNLKTKIITGALFVMAIIIAGYLVIPKLIRPAKKPEKSIAVLPFHNYSEESSQEYMSDGLTDEIINHLYKIKSFDKVVPTSSVFAYKATDKIISQIANELKVNYILEGTYKKIGDQVRVTAKLIDPTEDKYLWQREYDKPYNEILSIQADIALQIADQLKAYLTSTEKENIQKIPTVNPQAYDLMHQAQFLWNEKGFNAIDQILELFLKAIKLDPDYADAHAWAGMFTLLKGTVWGGNEMKSVAWDAESYFEKALELDQNSSAAHFGMAWFDNWIRWNYVNAEKEFLKALELEPNNPLYYQFYAEFLLQKGKLSDAMKQAVTRQQYFQVIRINILTGNKKETYSSLKKYLASEGSSVQKLVGECYIWMGKYDTAKLYLESAIKSKDPQMLMSRYQAELALAYHKTNQSDQAQKIINRQINSVNAPGNQDFFIGWYYSGIGEVDSAFYWLEKAYLARCAEFPWLKIDPGFTNLKKDARYWDLYERTGHKAYDDYVAETKRK